MKFILLLLCVLTVAYSRREIPEFEINLDLPASERYTVVIGAMKDKAQAAYTAIFGKLGVFKYALRNLARIRGRENSEMWDELKVFANAINVPV